MKALTSDPNLRIGMILKASRVRAGKTACDIATVVGVSDRMVRLWERDIRGIGRGKGIQRSEEVFSAYELTKEEREEVIHRISLRKQEYVENTMSVLLKNGKSQADHTSEKMTEEMQVLIQLLALIPEKRKWVIQMAHVHAVIK